MATRDIKSNSVKGKIGSKAHPGNAGCLSTLNPSQLAAAYVLMSDVGLDAGQAAKTARAICARQRDAAEPQGAAHTWFLVGAHLAHNPSAARELVSE